MDNTTIKQAQDLLATITEETHEGMLLRGLLRTYLSAVESGEMVLLAIHIRQFALQRVEAAKGA